ncbi:hypothetical protein K440DRAFT_538941 [Wilcoxina mikolae CBS 423.85]|nr:hypothetical protein K440DRAFT_538941 [Wilcoxina mikolae CBS 423.85]
MIFTPLVSPAVTPLETEFSRHIPDFVMPGAFSPLTSPALNAHHHRTHMPNPHMSHNPAPMQALTDPSQSPVLASGKRGSISSGRRKSTTSRNPARVVRESPSMKPQRKRAAPPTPLSAAPKASNTLAQQAPTYSPLPQTSGGSRRDPSTPAVSQQNTPMQHPLSQEGSSNESVSPEPLPEVLMAPPPRRSLSSRSPMDDGSSTAHKPLNAPVTPASLMRLPKTSLPTEDIPPISMDTSEYLNRDVEAQDATNMNGKQYNEEMPTSTMNRSSSRTPSLTPSLKPSRGTSRHTSPLDPVNPGAITKKEPARNSRKRGSVSSSPALQPKISPSIKPLLPIGMSPDASAFLLASKSNYQNIVEGNHSHLGLQYPEHLSTNLTSKRTSHKIAEQGRRNRINNALAEMAGLLPPINGGSAGSDSGTTGKEQTSKASTVELAIEYIRQLKRELEETKAKLKAVEDKLQSTGAATQDKGQKEDVGNEKEKKPGEISVEMEMNGEGTPAVATTA